MNLLPKAQLIHTNDVDHADWNYRPGLAIVMRRRFALVLSLLPDHSHRLLEIGFGSGVFMPELAPRCDELYGIEVHEETAQVQTHLDAYGVQAHLSQQSATHMSFDDEFFDCIVSVSALEFIDDIESAAAELARVLTLQGRLIAVMPGKSAFLDLALRITTGEDANHDYGDRRERVMPAMEKYFNVLHTKRFIPVYTAYEFRRLPRLDAASGGEKKKP